MRDEDNDSKWHLDKKVPIAIIVTILIQSGAILFYGGGFAQRVSGLETAMAAAVPRLESVIRLEAKVDAMNATLQELKAIVNRR